MAPSGKTYPAPTIPDTPSKAINDMLQTKCDKTFDNPVKYGVALGVCFTFTVIVRLYHLLHHEVRQSHTKWMMACGVFGSASILGAIVLYYVVLGCSCLLHLLLYYGCALIALAGVGLSVAGAMFFDKDGAGQNPGFETSDRATTNKRD